MASTSSKIDFDSWSKDSKRAFELDGRYLYSEPNPEFYESARCRCVKCSQSFVFTAEEQKYAYEVEKQYVWKERKRCNKCQAELEALQRQNKEFQEDWKEHSAILRRDRHFLTKWASVLEAIPLYGKRADESAISMIKKALHENI